jgi:hypothetical protein
LERLLRGPLGWILEIGFVWWLLLSLSVIVGVVIAVLR